MGQNDDSLLQTSTMTSLKSVNDVSWWSSPLFYVIDLAASLATPLVLYFCLKRVKIGLNLCDLRLLFFQILTVTDYFFTSVFALEVVLKVSWYSNENFVAWFCEVGICFRDLSCSFSRLNSCTNQDCLSFEIKSKLTCWHIITISHQSIIFRSLILVFVYTLVHTVGTRGIVPTCLLSRVPLRHLFWGNFTSRFHFVFHLVSVVSAHVV